MVRPCARGASRSAVTPLPHRRALPERAWSRAWSQIKSAWSRVDGDGYTARGQNAPVSAHEVVARQLEKAFDVAVVGQQQQSLRVVVQPAQPTTRVRAFSVQVLSVER
eukprot:643288-Rhodomonas_salina.1